MIGTRIPIVLAAEHAEQFTQEFLDWLPCNLRIYDQFCTEAFKVIDRGFKHYSARTILHVIRHHSALAEKSDAGWKVNNNHSPYLARLFDLQYPQHAGLFAHRVTPAVLRSTEEASA
ncbi:MAG: hypothetical protein RIS35_1858 [Pseudomonadota bacterium]